MNFSLIADIESAFESFFQSLTTSTTFNILFFFGIGLELFFILLFGIMSRFSYESRMRRHLDKLNRWLFVHRSLDKENIKEFNDMVKKAPKRLTINWQQYILYREKSPSQYMSVENIIEKPLRTSSFASNIKNLTWISIVWALVTFIVGISYQNFGDTILNATMLVTSFVIPLFIAIMCTIAVIILRARKNANLDELYQNLHLFQRFIDNTCVDLPPFIDYSLLFSDEEIDKGIPALREYLEKRARQEKEEFDKIAKEEGVTYEKYNFEGLGIDGQNILERAMKESEAYLSKRDKTLAKIAQIEASVESLKKNFENIQKDFQKRMQVSKENIERLRQQQEETTNRIESNFLRKQQNQEISKQEKEEADFEQQRRRFLVEKNEYEEVIKNLNDEIESNKNEVEEAMMSEYETFYTKLFNTAISEAEKKVKDKISSLTTANQNIEEDLTVKEAQLKRIIDENETLKRKLGLDYEQIKIETVNHDNEEEKQDENKKDNDFLRPDELSKIVQEKIQDSRADQPQELNKNNSDDQSESFSVNTSSVEEYVPSFDTNEFDFENSKNLKSDDLEPESQILSSTKRRGRPKKGEERTIEQMIQDKRSRGRPKKNLTENKDDGPKKRGRPVGSVKKEQPQNLGEKRSRGRPRKDEGSSKDLADINKKIDDEQKRLASIKEKIDLDLKNAVDDLELNSPDKKRRDEILTEIDELKERIEKIKNNQNANDDIEMINQRIEQLLNEIKSLNN